MRIRIIVYLVIFFAFIFGYVKYLESRGIYFPTKEISFTPAAVGLSYEDVFFQTRDKLEINGWFVPAKEAEYTILFCHGNAGNIGDRLDKIIIMNKMALNLFIIDYRGYGRSQGRPSEQGIYLDAQAGYDYLVNKRQINPERIIFYGESLGSAAVIYLAAKEKAGGLIVEGGFTKGREMAKRYYSFLPTFLFANTFDSLSRIKNAHMPKLFIHSKDDEIVPFSFARRLYNAACEPKHLAEMRGDHNGFFLDSKEKYVDAIKEFIQKRKVIRGND